MVTGRDLFLLAVSLLLSAFLTTHAINSPEYYWAVWICLFPLFLAIKMVPPFLAALSGGFWGLFLCVFMSTSIGEPTSSPPKPEILLVIVPALYAYGCSYLTHWLGFRPILLGLGWIGVELAVKPLGQPQGLLTQAQTDCIAIQTVARLFGYLFVSFLVGFINATLLRFTEAIIIKFSPPQLPRELQELTNQLQPDYISVISIILSSTIYPRAPPMRGHHICFQDN